MRRPASPSIRAAIVGAGLMGRWHAHELVRAGGTVVGVVDLDPAVADELTPVRSGARAFRDVDALVAGADLDVVHICTPPDTHVELAERLLAAGVHVLVEKPLAPDASQTERLLDGARVRDLTLCPVHQYLFQPGMRVAESVLDQIAPLVHLEFTACSDGGERASAKELDGIAGAILPHPLSLVGRLLRSSSRGAREIEDLTWSAIRPQPGELRALGGADGLSAAISISLSGRPTRNELRLIGAAGSVRMDLYHGFATFERGGVSRRRKIAQPFSGAGAIATVAALNLARRSLRVEPAYPGLRGLIERLYTAIGQGSSPPIEPPVILAEARVRDRLLSAAT